MNRNVYIQGLRGLLSSAIFVYHVILSGLGTFDNPVAALFNRFVLSWEFAVEIFFGVSGIVIFFAYRKAKTIPTFIIDRASRIFPVLWVAVILIFFLSKFDSRHVLNVTFLELIGNLFVLPPLLPIPLIHLGAWTLCYEFVFYLFFVMFGLLGRVLSARTALIITAVLGVVFVATHLRTFPFLVGLAVAYAIEKRPAWLVNFKYSGFAIFGAMLCMSIGTKMAGHYYVSLVGTFTSEPGPALLLLVAALLTFVGLAGTYFGKGLFCRVLATPQFQWLGALSFSLYISQGLTLPIVKRGIYVSGLADMAGPWSQLLFFALAFPLTLAISRLSQIYLEGRATNMVRDFAHKTILRPAASPAA